MATASRTKLRRHPERGHHDQETIFRILDEGFLCHVGFEQGSQPFVIPTLYARLGDTVYLHGSHISRMLKSLADGPPMCVTVTLVDGLVLARSAFHHSINYRSVMLLGRGRLVSDRGEKLEALNALVEHVVPGRTAEARGPDTKELRTTTVIAVPIDEASAKVRTGPPKDAPMDRDLEVWGGVIPLRLQALEPIPDPEVQLDLPLPEYVRHYRGPSAETEATKTTSFPSGSAE